MCAHPSGPRPLPSPPVNDVSNHTWYEAEQRMTPSYILPPRSQPQQGWQSGDNAAAVGRQPGSPRSPETRGVGSPQLGTSYYDRFAGNGLGSPTRIVEDPFESDRSNRTGTLRGSAFMHKGFMDLLHLANDRRASAVLAPPARLQPGGYAASPPQSPSRLSRFRKLPTFANKIPELSPLDLVPADSPPVVSPSPLHRSSPGPLPTTPSPPVRATKKRISVDMISAPRPSSFVHAAHASDMEEAMAILDRWSRDGQGFKVADHQWYGPLKEAFRNQAAARTQAEAIAEVQAAMHTDSRVQEAEKRGLRVVNGLASTATAGGFTVDNPARGGSTIRGGETHGSSPFSKAFQRIVEEGVHDGDPVTGLPDASNTHWNPLASPPTSPWGDGTADTCLVRPEDSPRLGEVEEPDYMRFMTVRQKPNAVGPSSLDYLPLGAPKGIQAVFEPQRRPTTADAIRPLTALVAEESPNQSQDGPSLDSIAATEQTFCPSLETVEKSVAAKIFFENLYYGILKKPASRETRRVGLEQELLLLRISEDSKEAIRQAWSTRETEHLRSARARVGANAFVRLKNIGHGAFGVVSLVREKNTGELYAMKRLKKADMLRKGQEGHIRAERDLMTAAASAGGSRRWIVNLIYSFQDVEHLYLVMEFMGGGDLLNLLIEKDLFEEDFARFYVAEMILAVHEAHRLGYIHRDIKPDNFLFTAEGHLKLADFGLCQSFHWAHDGAYYDQQRRNLLLKHGIDLEDGKRSSQAGGATSKDPSSSQRQGELPALGKKELKEVMSDRQPDGTPLTHVFTFREQNRRKIAHSVVGTNNYMAPEVLRGLGYDQACDWWSLGVIVFEMLYGYPAFISKSRGLTRQKIVNWKQTLKFPNKPKVSKEARDFIAGLLCDKEDRLGSVSSASVSRPNSLLQNSRRQSGFGPPVAGSSAGGGGLRDGVEELMAHPWFRGIDFAAILTQKAPFKPALAHPADTKHFDENVGDEPLATPGAVAGAAVTAQQSKDPMLRDADQGEKILDMRKQLAFVGYTFKRPPGFDPRVLKEQLQEAASPSMDGGDTVEEDGPAEDVRPSRLDGSRMRAMSM